MQAKMLRAEFTTAGQTTDLPLASVISHRKLVAMIFPWSLSKVTRDAAVAAVGDQEEMFHCAASQGMRVSVRALLKDRRVSYDVRDRFGRTPLHWAAEQGHCKVALELLGAGAWVEPRSQRKVTPIMLAAYNGHAEVAELLLKFRAGDSDRKPLNRHLRENDHWRRTALHCAAAGGHVPLVEVLLSAGFDRAQQDGAGLTPAEVSARKSHSASPAITQLLLPTSDRGGKLVYDYVNMAVQDVAMVTGLVKAGVSLEWRDGTGDTPLHRAALFGHVVTSRVLLQAGADPNICDNYGESPLHVAASHGCGEIVAALLEAGSQMEHLAVDGHSPLHRAVLKNKVNIVKLLLTAGASTEHLDVTQGQTPLSWACRGCLASIVRALAEAGADIESRCSAGLTPLHWACRLNDAESVEALLNAGADPSAVDQTAEYARVTSSSPRGMMASIPVAIDVIGLGYPLDRVEDWRHPFTGGSVPLAARRLDLKSVRRIESALQGAKKEKSWRRRGWLVMFAEWRAAVVSVKDRCEQRVVYCEVCGCSSISSSIPPPPSINLIEHPPCACLAEAAVDPADADNNNDSSESKRSHEELCGRSTISNRTLAAEVVVISRAARGQQSKLRDNIGEQKNISVFLPNLVDALLKLATVEVGLFRKVVMFI